VNQYVAVGHAQVGVLAVSVADAHNADQGHGDFTLWRAREVPDGFPVARLSPVLAVLPGLS
jgi:hypothetical protein